MIIQANGQCAPNLRIRLGANSSKGLLIEHPGHPSTGHAQLYIQPLRIEGNTLRFPDRDVKAGDISCSAEYSPARLYFFNGNSWVQVA
ncbi:MAG: hypothetical protein KTR25_04320 [Myxococcales bacterium]|nr:hypothetical protein [Myxococcales bacterium]